MSPRPHKVRVSLTTDHATISVSLTRNRRWDPDNAAPFGEPPLTEEMHRAVSALERILAATD